MEDVKVHGNCNNLPRIKSGTVNAGTSRKATAGASPRITTLTIPTLLRLLPPFKVSLCGSSLLGSSIESATLPALGIEVSLTFVGDTTNGIGLVTIFAMAIVGARRSGEEIAQIPLTQVKIGRASCRERVLFAV